MGRDYCINGIALVKVKGCSASPIGDVQELGLSTDQIEILPRWQHKDLNIDDFGPNIPPEVLWLLADVQIKMKLVHTDPDILVTCINESMTGSSDGTLAPAGRPMGYGQELFGDKNHYISLNILSPELELPWRFRAAYLAEQPIRYPVGTDVSIFHLNWRAIPYAFPKVVGGTPGQGNVVQMQKYPLWDRVVDEPNPQLGG